MPLDENQKAMLGETEEVEETQETTDTETDTDKTETDEANAEKGKDESDTETDTGDVDPLQKVMDESGLTATYANPEAALRGVVEKNRYIEEQREENRKLHDLLKQQLNRAVAQPQQTTEEFVDQFAQDPNAALRASGYVHESQLQGVQKQVASLEERQHNAALSFAAAKHPDIASVAPYLAQGHMPPAGANPLWDRMWAIHTQHGVNANGPEATIDMLHQLARPTPASSPTVPSVPDNKKAGASTAGSDGRKTISSVDDVPDFNKMTADEIESFYKKHGLVD